MSDSNTVGSLIGLSRGIVPSFCYIVMKSNKQQMTMGTRIFISEEAISQEVGGETVILDLNGEQYFGLDAVGTRIWQLLKECGETEEVFDRMLGEFDVAPEQLRKDLTQLISQLSDAGLVETTDSDSN